MTDQPGILPRRFMHCVPTQVIFSLSPSGTVRVDDKGNTLFTALAEGKHRYLILNEATKARALEALILLASQPR
jgi:hypothetical protein